MSTPEDERDKEWSENVAALAVDVLVDFGLIEKQSFDDAVKIVAEEILVRLAIGDRPGLRKS